MSQKISKHIAAALKSLRHNQGWSLDKTAQQTGVSKAMLGQIEREESSPTIATLWKIANGFHVPFSSFLAGNDMGSQSPVYTSKQRIKTEEKIHVTALFPFDPETSSEIFLIELLPNCEHISLSHEPGVIEHVIVVSGTMDLLLDSEWQTLQCGEAVRFNANQSHGYRNLTSTSAYFHNIIHYPKRK